ncbi:NAD(P)-dependent oxidoreductase [Nonomuraea typhae]|uniref:NAD(P)-dependent oxidoreductase n=1 Tax=Nonomuraea typhae TaxID=2603600 RepID=A0ABW7YVF8_9ACTN
MRVAWIGTGLMGEPMARRVLEAGHQVTVYNRTPAKTADLAARGASVAASVADAVRGLALPEPTADATSGLAATDTGLTAGDARLAAPDTGLAAVDAGWAAVGAGLGVAGSGLDGPDGPDGGAWAEVVVTMLPYPDDVERVYAEVFEAAAPGTVAVDCSTSSPALARALAERGAARGIAVLDAPVSGGPAGAHAGSLSVMVGGEAAALERIRLVLGAVAGTVVHHGGPGAGQVAKLVNQTLVAGVTLAACEAYALAEQGGLDIDKALASVRPGVAGSPLMEFIWTRLRSGDLEPGFKLDHFLKDLGLAREAAGGLNLSGLDQVIEVAERVRAAHGGERGTQALVKAAE